MTSITISIVALFISIGTAYILHKNRLEANRPIVTAKLESECNDLITALTIRLYNTGLTPALDITLEANEDDILKAFVVGVSDISKKEVLRCLTKENTIPIIHNNDSVENGFGVLSNNSNNTFKLKSEIPITIKYKSLYGYSYVQKQTLIIKITDNFAGSGWKKDKKNATTN